MCVCVYSCVCVLCVLFKGSLPQVNGARVRTTCSMTVLVGVEAATPISISIYHPYCISNYLGSIMVTDLREQEPDEQEVVGAE